MTTINSIMGLIGIVAVIAYLVWTTSENNQIRKRVIENQFKLDDIKRKHNL